MNQKTITDAVSADVICQFGLRHKLDYWKPSSPVFRKLKQLTRERTQILNEKTVLLGQKHSDEKEHDANKSTLKRIDSRIKLLNKQVKEIEKEINQLTESDDALKIRVKRIVSIPSIGIITAVTILAETNGFELFRNKKQVASYAGFDVVQKQSGISVLHKTKISKKGNVYLRKALFFPAMTSVKYNNEHRDLLNRLINKHNIKMKGYVAIQRKLLELVYIIDKTQQSYDKDYTKKMKALPEVEPSESSLC